MKSERREMKTEKAKGRERVHDKLFNRNKPKAYIEVQKVTNLIKNLDLEEFDNRVFYEAFNIVSHPESLRQRKAGLFKMLNQEHRKTDRVKKTLERPDSQQSRMRR